MRTQFEKVRIPVLVVMTVSAVLASMVVQGGFGFRAQPALAAPASIWTTQITCANPADQDANEYSSGNTVYVRGRNFVADATYYGKITGLPGSADPSQVVATFSATASDDAEGYFCVAAYVVGSDGDLDDGVYTDVWDNPDYDGPHKNDNYHVNGELFGSVSGTKFYDWDHDNATDGNDQTLAGWTIKLYTDGWSFLNETTTDGNGNYSFIDLPEDEYYVCEVVPTGWTHSFNPAGSWNNNEYCRSVDVTSNENTDGVDFHNYLTGAIHGRKWNDSDGNGLRCTLPELNPTALFERIIAPSCEPYLNGWTIFLDSNGNGQLDGSEPSFVTQNHNDQDGWYWFEDLVPGTYSVCEIEQTGWDQTYPQTANSCHTVTVPQPNEGDSCVAEFQLNASETAQSLCDFGNQEQATVTVLKNVDMNADGDTTDPEDAVGATDWTWDVNSGNQNYATGSTQTVTPGSTTVGEDMKTGYEFVNVACDVNEDPIAVSQSTAATFETSTGGHYTCTFTNKKTPTPPAPPVPVLTLAKLDTPDPVADDANITYTVNYSVATVQATNVVITDPLPANTTFVSAGNGGTYNSATNTVTWNLGTVAVGSYSTTLVLHVNANVADGTVITNVATIDSAETDPLQASQATTVKRQDPALSLTKVVNVTFANPGDVVLYTVTVKNTGTDTAHNLTLTDTLPAGFTFVENGKNTITKTFLDSLAVGASASMSYQVTVGSKVTAGTFDNLAVVQGTGVGPVSAKAGLEVRKPQVLGDTTPQVKGAETLPETGASPLDLAQVALSGLTALGGAALIIRRRKI